MSLAAWSGHHAPEIDWSFVCLELRLFGHKLRSILHASLRPSVLAW